jgi:glycosyltransferase involved in cell wall biosynthesis
MRILAVSRNFPNYLRPYEGPWALTQFKALQSYGAELRVLSPRVVSLSTFKNRADMFYAIKRPTYWAEEGIEVYGPKFPYWISGKAFRHTYALQTYMGLKKYLKKLYDKWPFDILYTQAIYPDAIAATKFKKDYDIKTCGCIIGQAEVAGKVRNRKIRDIVVSTLEELDLVVAGSKSVAADAESLIGNKRSVHLIMRGIFPEDYKTSETICEKWSKWFGFPEHCVIAMFVGHIYIDKGVFDLLEAFAKIHDEVPYARLVFVGSGDQDQILKHEIGRLNLSSKVRMTGVVPPKHVISLMSLSDFVVTPSHHEALGGVNIEAGFTGRAVIGANVGGIPEVVIDGHNGLLFEAKNLHDLSNKMKLLYENRNFRIELGMNGKSFMMKTQNAHENNKKLLNLFERVLHEGKI